MRSLLLLLAVLCAFARSASGMDWLGVFVSPSPTPDPIASPSPAPFPSPVAGDTPLPSETPTATPTWEVVTDDPPVTNDVLLCPMALPAAIPATAEARDPGIDNSATVPTEQPAVPLPETPMLRVLDPARPPDPVPSWWWASPSELPVKEVEQ